MTYSNRGAKASQAWTEDGSIMGHTFHIVGVPRPLASVGRMTDHNNMAVSGRTGGYILNLACKSAIHFPVSAVCTRGRREFVDLFRATPP